jgi:hypothetical protein
MNVSIQTWRCSTQYLSPIVSQRNDKALGKAHLYFHLLPVERLRVEEETHLVNSSGGWLPDDD